LLKTVEVTNIALDILDSRIDVTGGGESLRERCPGGDAYGFRGTNYSIGGIEKGLVKEY
jgi:hypothetical protein